VQSIPALAEPKVLGVESDREVHEVNPGLASDPSIDVDAAT
jgi:hypothetical protein